MAPCDENIGAGPSSGSSSATSLSLLAGVRIGDAEAWARLVRLYGPVVYGWCRQAGLQPSDSTDVVQDVLRSVLTNIEGFRREHPGDSFRGWLWTITRNKLRDFFRRAASRPAAVGGTDARQRLEQLPELLSDDDAQIQSSSEANRVIHRALELVRDEFEERTWQAFWQATVDGHQAAEVARDLGMTNGAVRQAKYRVLRRMRQQLDELL